MLASGREARVATAVMALVMTAASLSNVVKAQLEVKVNCPDQRDVRKALKSSEEYGVKCANPWISK